MRTRSHSHPVTHTLAATLLVTGLASLPALALQAPPPPPPPQPQPLTGPAAQGEPARAATLSLPAGVSGDWWARVRADIISRSQSEGSELDSLSTSPSWTAEGDQASAQFGFSVGTAGDVNRDGFADVIVGAPGGCVGGQCYAGRAYVYHGSASGLSTTPRWTAECDQAGAAFGSSVGTAGDVNGDGFADVIVGAPEYTREVIVGRVFVYHGSSSGLSATPSWTFGRESVPLCPHRIGDAVSTAGDVNGDGFAEVIIGVPTSSCGTKCFGEGSALVFYGSATGLSATRSRSLSHCSTVSAQFGSSVGAAGDVNGDGFGDVIVGAPSWRLIWQAPKGAVSVFFGSASGDLLTESSVVGDQDYADFGAAAGTAGDVNGDGFADVIVGAPAYDNGQTNEGRAYVYFGSPSGLSASPSWTTESDQEGGCFGAAVGGAGDVDGDGFADVIVGAPGCPNTQSQERAYVYHGTASGLSTTSSWIGQGDQADSDFGRSAGTAGDVNGDGSADVIVGAPGYSNGQAQEGSVSVYHGPALTPFPPARIVIDDRAVAEGNATNASFRVLLSSPSIQTVTVDYTTADDTAVAPSDYEATSGTLTFTPGRTSHSIAVPVVTDSAPEAPEQFFVSLSHATNATILRVRATGRIDDPPAAANVRMWRAYNPNADYHFFTTARPEFDNAVAHGYRDETTGRTGFCVPNTADSGTTAIFRMYNPNTGRHYYSVGAGERDSLKGIGWVYEKDEGSIFTALGSGLNEIFKLYNRNSGVHLYTESASTKDAILAMFPGIWFQHTSLGYAFASPVDGSCP